MWYLLFDAVGVGGSDSAPAKTMWCKLLYSGFETRFGPSTQGAGIRYQNSSQIQILRHFEKKKERDIQNVEFENLETENLSIDI